jgi:hypothetical protein
MPGISIPSWYRSKSKLTYDRRSNSKLTYDRRSVGQSLLIWGHHKRSVTNFSFTFMENTFRHLPFSSRLAPSLTRGRIWNLSVKLLQDLTSAVTLRSKSRRTRDHILLSQFEDWFHLYPLLRHARLRWRCCIPPPYESGICHISRLCKYGIRQGNLTVVWSGVNLKHQVSMSDHDYLRLTSINFDVKFFKRLKKGLKFFSEFLGNLNAN